MAGAESSRSGREFTFRHTKRVHERIEDARMALRGVRAGHEEFLALAEDLAVISVTENQRTLFLSEFVPMPPEALISDRVARNVEEARAAVLGILNGPTTAEGHRFTAYGLFQSGVEYLDHVRRANSAETYFGRSMLRQEPAKAKLARRVREVAVA